MYLCTLCSLARLSSEAMLLLLLLLLRYDERSTIQLDREEGYKHG